MSWDGGCRIIEHSLHMHFSRTLVANPYTSQKEDPTSTYEDCRHCLHKKANSWKSVVPVVLHHITRFKINKNFTQLFYTLS